MKIITFETFGKSLTRLSRLLKVLSCPRLSRLANTSSQAFRMLDLLFKASDHSFFKNKRLTMLMINPYGIVVFLVLLTICIKISTYFPIQPYCGITPCKLHNNFIYTIVRMQLGRNNSYFIKVKVYLKETSAALE